MAANKHHGPWKPWAGFQGQLKQAIEEAWSGYGGDKTTVEVVIEIQGNNPITGYRVSLGPPSS